MNDVRRLARRDWVVLALGGGFAVASALVVGAIVGWPMPAAIGVVIVACGTWIGLVVAAKRKR